MVVPENAVPAEPVARKQLLFDGSRKPLFWLLLRNLGLMIITLGIYRFWAKTRVRQFFWRHTNFLDEPLEYLGTGAELFVGFLIAIVVLVPLGAVYSLLQFFFIGQPFWVSMAVDAVYYTVILFLVQIAIHRMRRYRLTRTSWRGVRFGLDGSSLRYALISFGYGLLTMVTLWLAYPWLRVATLKYFFNNARFGSSTLSLEASGRWLFKRWIVAAIPFALGIVAFSGLNWDTFTALGEIEEKSAQGQDVGDDALMLIQQIQYWPLAIFVLSIAIQIWYGVVEFRHIVGGVRLDNVSLKSEMPAPFVYRVYIVFWISIFFFIGLVAAVFGVSFDWDQNDAFGAGGSGHIALTVLFLLFFFSFGLLRTLFIDVALLKRACETMTVDNPQDLDRVIQSSANLPSHGEGLADALDVGGF